MKTDLFGRTEEQLVAAIASKERIYKIASGFPGGRYIQELERQQSNLDVDRHQLAILRGEIVDDTPTLTPEGRRRLHTEILRLGRK